MSLSQNLPLGELSEWLKEHAWKACIREIVSSVRISHSPPVKIRSIAQFGSASGLGPEGRGFESLCSDQLPLALPLNISFLLLLLS